MNLNVNMHDKTNKARNLNCKYRRQFMLTAGEEMEHDQNIPWNTIKIRLPRVIKLEVSK